MRCSRCGKDKPKRSFHIRKAFNGIRRVHGQKSLCIPCEREYGKEHYQAHKDEYTARTKINREKCRRAIQKLKEKPCADCNNKFPYYVMDFDHTGEKKETVSKLVRIGAIRRAIEEIKKCEVVCANCHRIRTHKRSTGVV